MLGILNKNFITLDMISSDESQKGVNAIDFVLQ